MVTRTIPYFITLHNVDTYGNAYDEPIRINAAQIAYYYDFEGASCGRQTAVRLTSDRKLFTKESADEIDKLLMRREMEIR